MLIRLEEKRSLAPLDQLGLDHLGATTEILTAATAAAFTTRICRMSLLRPRSTHSTMRTNSTGSRFLSTWPRVPHEDCCGCTRTFTTFILPFWKNSRSSLAVSETNPGSSPLCRSHCRWWMMQCRQLAGSIWMAMSRTCASFRQGSFSTLWSTSCLD